MFRVMEPIATRGPRFADLTLCRRAIKFDRFEWMVEKATELGVEGIVPVEATRTEKGSSRRRRKRAERWRRIAREASRSNRGACKCRRSLPGAMRFDRA